jgi:hypothetical protein
MTSIVDPPVLDLIGRILGRSRDSNPKAAHHTPGGRSGDVLASVRSIVTDGDGR